MALVLAGLSALMYGFADFSGGFASNRSRILSVLIVSQAMGTVLAVAALLVFWPGLPGLADILWGCLGGLSGALGLFMLYRGIAKSIVAVVSPASALVGALLPLGFGVLVGERPSPLALVGAALCLPAVVFLSWSSEHGEGGKKAVRSALAQGLVAGVGFGGFFIAVSRTARSSGLWPLIASRSASILVALVAVIVSRQKIRIDPKSRVAALAAGFSDMGANICFLLASRSGLLALVSIVASLYPAPTVLLARFFFRQRISPIRGLGLGLALAGVALISLR